MGQQSAHWEGGNCPAIPSYNFDNGPLPVQDF